MQLYQPTITGSLLVSGSVNISGSLTMIGGTLSGTASLASTASSADNFTVRNTLTATTLVVQTITSSVSTITGSTNFGSLLANTHNFTGSVSMTGSLAVVTTGTEFQVNSTGVNLGNALTDSHVISGSVRINPNGLFITSSGNVGIGTTTPNDLLEVRGGFIRISATSGNGPQFNLYSNGQTSNHVTLAQGFALATDNIGYLYNRANADFVFGTNNTERMRISAAGNVGIGVTPSSWYSVYKSLQIGYASLYNDASVNSYLASNAYVGTDGNFKYTINGGLGLVGIEGNSFVFYNASSGTANTTAGIVERFRINSSGVSIIKGDGTSLSGRLEFYSDSTPTYAASIGTTGAGIAGVPDGSLRFNLYNGTWSEKMRIASNGSTTITGPTLSLSVQSSYSLQLGSSAINLALGANSTAGYIQSFASLPLYLNNIGNAVYAGTQRIDNNSDQRVKENIQPITNALDTVLSLNGRKFNMIDEDNILRYGFVAQEVQPYLSDFVTESTREYKDENIHIENLLTLETSGAAWSALLVEAIKQQQAQINELKSLLNK